MAALSRGARLIGFNGPEEEAAAAAAAAAKEVAGRVRGAARAVRAPAGSRVTRAAGTRGGGGGGGGWVRAAGPLRIPRGRHWPAAGIVRRAAPAGTLRCPLRRAGRRGRAAHPGRESASSAPQRPRAVLPARSLARSLVRRPTPNFFFYLSFNCLLFLRMNDLSLLS